MGIKVAVIGLVPALAVCLAACSGGGSSFGTQSAGSTGASSSSIASAAESPVPGSSQAPGSHSPAPATDGTSAAGHESHASSHKTGLSPRSAADVVAWYHSAGGQDFTNLTKALDHASRAQAKGGLVAFGHACPGIASSAEAAQAGPPIPVAKAARWYVPALAAYVKFASTCEQGLSAHDTRTLRQAAAGVSATSTDLNRAAAVLITALSDG
jgi:hypothetical protein